MSVFAESPHEGLKSIPASMGEIVTYSGLSYFSCIPNICWWSKSMRAAYPNREHRLVDFGSHDKEDE